MHDSFENLSDDVHYLTIIFTDTPFKSVDELHASADVSY